MDKKTINLIRQSLRNASLRWNGRYEALKKAKVYKPRYKKDGSLSKKPFVFFKCSACKKDTFKQKEVEVNHIQAVGRFTGCWNGHISRLFCDISGLEVLCKKCHKEVTRKQGLKI